MVNSLVFCEHKVGHMPIASHLRHCQSVALVSEKPGTSFGSEPSEEILLHFEPRPHLRRCSHFRTRTS